MATSKNVIAGRYELGKIVGSGGMADVYVAHDSVSGNKVAIKVLKEELSKNPKFVARFKQEARAASAMHHPNIVEVLDAGDDKYTDEDGTVHRRSYLVMEQIQGLELSKLTARGPLKVSEATRVAAEVLAAVEYAHTAGVVHRDIKPSNIMVTKSGNVKILDFGIARAVADTFDDLAQTTTILGTAAYFSPEQAQGKKVDARTDIYSIGVVLFEMLTGRTPFEADTAVAVAHQHIHTPPPAPSSFNKKVSPALDIVVLKALSKKPADRYQNTLEFGRELGLAAAGHVPTPPVVVDEVDELLGPISEPAAERVDPEMPPEFSFLFGTDPQTAPQLVVPTAPNHNPKRVMSGILVVVLIFGAIVGMGLWVATLKPADIFPASVSEVPSVTGKTYAKASADIRGADLVPEKLKESSDKVAEGKVIRTRPAAGNSVDPGSKVQVFVSSGKAMAEVPNVADLSIADATTALESAGFKVGSVSKANSATVKNDFVINTSPSMGVEAEVGAEVSLIVSDGNINIPDVRGKTVKEANTILGGTDIGIVPSVDADLSCPRGAEPTVKWQSPGPGIVPQGTAVKLTYCAA